MNKISTWGAGIFAGIVFAAAPFTAGAVSLEDLQMQLKNLLAQIAQVQSTTRVDTSSQGSISISARPTYRVCDTTLRGLSLGSRGDEVMSLQEFLRGEGYLSANATGYFGPMTSRALAQWQNAEGISAVGVFGPVSQARMMRWCGDSGTTNTMRFEASPTNGSAPLAVTFNTWISGFHINTVSYVIDYGDGVAENATSCNAPADACVSPGVNTHTYAANGTYTATLSKITNPCAGQEMICKAAIQTEVVAKQQITVGPVACTMEYAPVCGAKQVTCIKTPCNPVPTTYGNRCAMNADGATYLYSGQCKDTTTNPENDPQCKVWYDGCNTCSRSNPGGPAMCTLMACMTTGDITPVPYCKSYFDETSIGNKPPTVSGLSGPSTLAINAAGTWTIQASDPENGNLSYSVTWGDEKMFAYTMGAADMSRAFTQTTTFTHAYASAGTFTVTVTVKDDAGKTATATATVKVGNTVACTKEYVPVCGQPKWSCPSGMFCAMMMAAPQTYSNSCELNAAGATFLYNGQCNSNIGGGVACTADAMQCPNGQWVGRTGPSCQFVCN